MYDYISGNLAELSPAYAVVDVQGVGYFIRISTYTYDKIARLERVKLYVELVVREDGHFLFGFFDKEERELFRMLVSVSGIGSNSALVLLSAFDPQKLREAIIGENVAMLKSVKGIGPKTAKRLIVELKDKMAKDWDISAVPPAATDNRSYEEAMIALEVLGYPRKVTGKIIGSVLKEQPGLTTEQIIKAVLKRL